jgi:hypothetical protein
MYDNSLFDKYNIPRPPVFSGVVGTGADAMYSVGGKWLKAGQKTSDGYLINNYDPKSYTLGMDYAGVPVPVSLQKSVVAPYQPQFMQQHKGESDADIERLRAMGVPDDQIESILNPTVTHAFDGDQSKFMGFDKKALDNIRENIKNNPRVNYDHNGVVSYEEYQKLIQDNKAKEGLYLLPYFKDDGDVDLADVYFDPTQLKSEKPQ